MQIIVMEDGEELTSRFDSMEAAISGKIDTLGDKMMELVNSIAEKQAKTLKDEITQLREELRKVHRDLRKVTKMGHLKGVKKGEKEEWEVVTSDLSEPSESEEINKGGLEGMPCIADQIQKEPLLKEEASNVEKLEVRVEPASNEKGKTGSSAEEVCDKGQLSSQNLDESKQVEPQSLLHPPVYSDLKIFPINLAVGKVPLTSAALSGDVDEVRKLLASGASIRMRDAWGLNALHYAAVCGFTDIVKLLLDKSKDLVSTRASTKDNGTPLHLAAEKGHRRIAEVLIAASADVSAKNAQGQTALHVAALQGHSNLVDLLLSKGADIMCIDAASQSSLHLAAKSGHVHVVNILLDRGADVRQLNSLKQTALHLAAREGHSTVVEVLFHRGSEIGKVDSQNYSPLHYAAGSGHTNIVKFLLSRNADVSLRSVKDETALCCAANNGHYKTVKALTAKGISLTLSNQNALLALDMAAQQKHSWVVSALFEATPDLTGGAGGFAVCAAVEKTYVHALKALVLEGANPNAKGLDGRFAIEIAQEMREKFKPADTTDLVRRIEECKKILEDCGATSRIKDALSGSCGPQSGWSGSQPVSFGAQSGSFVSQSGSFVSQSGSSVGLFGFSSPSKIHPSPFGRPSS